MTGDASGITYSFVVPIYNDGYLARQFCIEFEKAFKDTFHLSSISNVAELIFVNDGSPDNSIVQLKALLTEFDFLRIIDLSRNFGQHIAIACGFREAKGRFVGRMNVDMQDPPSEIPKFIEAIESSGADLVIGVYEQRQSSLIDRFTSHIFFVFFNWLSGAKIPHNTSPLRIMSRRYIDAYNQLTEKTRFPQGLDSWLGFDHRFIKSEHRERIDKRSSYTLRKRLRLAVEAGLSFSERPLALIFWLGFALVAFGLCYSAFLIAWRAFSGNRVPGYASTIILFTLFSGFQNIGMGIVAQYIGRVLQETQNRPLYLIKGSFASKVRYEAPPDNRAELWR